MAVKLAKTFGFCESLVDVSACEHMNVCGSVPECTGVWGSVRTHRKEIKKSQRFY